MIPTNTFLERVATKAGFHTSNVPLGGFTQQQSETRILKGTKTTQKTLAAWSGTILEFLSLEAFPAASGKFQGTKPDGIRKTGGNPAGAGVRQEGTALEKTLLPRLRLAAT